MFKLLSRAAVALSVIATSGAALAESGQISSQDANRQFVIDLGVGAIAQPRYEAADSYLVYPFPIISVGRFYLPGLGQVVDGRRRNGIFFFPSFNFIGERSADDSSDLRGTDTVDWAVEVGLGGGFRTQHFRAFAELRQGFNGHTGQVGQLGVDGIFYPTEKWEVSIGPRAGFASSEYMDTYFGVTAAEAAASGGQLSEFDPGAGFKSLGIAAIASYDFNDDIRFHVKGGYDRLVGDAANSPIADVGSKDQFSFGVGVSYRFAFDVFN